METCLPAIEVTHTDLSRSIDGVLPSSGNSYKNSSRKSAVNSATSWSGGFGLIPFGFEAKTSYDASESLVNNRSNNFKHRPPTTDDNIWKRPPPDFRPQNFAPKPPKRNSRESQQPWKYGTIPGHRTVVKKQKVVRLPCILQPQPPKEIPFVTQFPKIPDSYEAKLEACKDGYFKPGPYQPPVPYDFRGLQPIESLGLPEFDVWYDKDPYKIHFLSRNLNQIHGLSDRPPSGPQHHGRQMAPPKTPQPEWEARLILDKEPWPLRSGEYTRYRQQGRSPHSAFMERIEETLTAQWAKEKLEKSLKEQTQC